MYIDNYFHGFLVLVFVVSVVSGCSITGRGNPENSNESSQTGESISDALSFLHEKNPALVERLKDSNDFFKHFSPSAVQVRVFREYPVTTNGKDMVKAIQVYGMRILPDGSEKVVWKRYIDKAPNRIVSDRYREAHVKYVDKKVVYVEFDHGKEGKTVYKLDRPSGKIAGKFNQKDKRYKEAEKYIWEYYPIIERPAWPAASKEQTVIPWEEMTGEKKKEGGDK